MMKTLKTRFARTSRMIVGLTMILAFMLSVPAAYAQSTSGDKQITQSVIAGGGGQGSSGQGSTGGTYSLDGTTGQAAAGTRMSGGTYAQVGGFWGADANATPTPGPTQQFYTFITTQGNLSTSGEYTQVFSSFQRYQVSAVTPSLTPTATSTPSPTPCVPTVGGTLYSGTHTLSDGQTGSFTLFVENSANSPSTGAATPDTQGQQLQLVSQGTATVTLQIDQAMETGTGTIQLQNGDGSINGSITINSKTDIPANTCTTLTPAISTLTPNPMPTPIPSPVTVQFTQTIYSVKEGCTSAPIKITRTGDTSGTNTVDYQTADVTAT